MNFQTVEEFEHKIAEFYSAPYAVATDCCTHAIELCLRYQAPSSIITVPKNTYVSVPMTLEKLNISWEFRRERWSDYYALGGTDIVDSAVYWKQNGYLTGMLQCLSFQFKKHLSLGRGGAILCPSYDDYIVLKKMSYDGRLPNIPWQDQAIDTIGYHYYMTPETAQLGLDRLQNAVETVPKKWTWKDYPDLSTMPVFKNK